MPNAVDYVFGLDLGKIVDPCALVALARQEAGLTGDVTLYRYEIVHIVDFPLQTPTREIFAYTDYLMHKEPFAGCTTVAMDRTGAGETALEIAEEYPDLLEQLWAIWISTGKKIQRDGSRLNVPKHELVQAALTAMQRGHVKVSKHLRNWDKLRRQLLRFEMKRTAAGNQKMEAASQADHDDICVSFCLAAWLGTQIPQEYASGQSRTMRGFAPYRVNEGNENSTTLATGGTISSWRDEQNDGSIGISSVPSVW